MYDKLGRERWRRRVVAGVIPHGYGACGRCSAAVVRRRGDRRSAGRFRRYCAVLRDFGDVFVACRPCDVFSVGVVWRDRGGQFVASAGGEDERRFVERHAGYSYLFKRRRYFPVAAPGHVFRYGHYVR